MILDMFSALLTAGLPLYLLSFALVSLALHRGWLAGASVKELQDSIDALGKAQKDKKNRERVNPALGKWFSFGGGFYGLVALYTWLLIEWDDAANFLQGLASVIINLDPNALLGLVLELLIESLINFGLAIGWPGYWMAASGNQLFMFVAAYAGYWLGIKTAQHGRQHGWVREAIDRITARLRRRD